MKLKKWGIGVLLVFGVLFLIFKFIAWPYLQKETKKISPETTAIYQQDGFDLKVTYSSPSKKGRVIFGDLVPYDQVWRTGANEPTAFTTASGIKIGGKDLPAGTYSLWTIPKQGSWIIIFNKEVPEWGVTLLSGGKKTTRDADNDVLQIEVTTTQLFASQEDFLIQFIKTNKLQMTLSWDTVAVVVPISK